MMKKNLLLALLLSVTASAFAVEEEIGGLWYELISKTKKAKVIQYKNNNLYSGNIVIPEAVAYGGANYSVTSIGNRAFQYCSGLTSVTIPNSVTSIGSYAFSYCSGLTSITIGNGVTSIGGSAFYDCSGLTSPVYNATLFAYMPTSYTGSYNIPNGIKEICGGAFNGCSGLTSITIPNSVTSIGQSAFFECSGLTSVHISDIAAWCKIAFGVVFSNPLEYAHHLYLGEEEITDLVIPNSVTSIGDRAFLGCSGLTSVTIPNSVTSIGEAAFCLCSGLTSVTIPNSVTSIGQQAFNGCSSLTSITIPNSVTSIGDRAFIRCSGLTSVTIPNSVTSIGQQAFNGCSGLTSVTIGNSVTSIGESAFSGCSGLTSVTIGNSVTSIGDGAFSGCTSLMTVKSYIEKPFNVSRFSNETYREGTLFVPKGTKDLYIRFDGWREFLNIEEMDEGATPAPNGTCATPTITIIGKKIKLSCETPGAVFTSTLTTKEQLTGDELIMESRDITYTLTVVASAEGYDDSAPATLNFTIPNGDLNGDGNVNSADIQRIYGIMAAQ